MQKKIFFCHICKSFSFCNNGDRQRTSVSDSIWLFCYDLFFVWYCHVPHSPYPWIIFSCLTSTSSLFSYFLISYIHFLVYLSVFFLNLWYIMTNSLYGVFLAYYDTSFNMQYEVWCTLSIFFTPYTFSTLSLLYLVISCPKFEYLKQQKVKSEMRIIYTLKFSLLLAILPV